MGHTPYEVVELVSLSRPETPQEVSPLAPIPTFPDLYDTYFPYIWRSVQRLGVPPSHADDAVQEVFIVVHRRLPEFQGRSALKTWLYGIALRVARAHRNQLRQSRDNQAVDAEQLAAPEEARPDERAQDAEAARFVNALLDGLDEIGRAHV